MKNQQRPFLSIFVTGTLLLSTPPALAHNGPILESTHLATSYSEHGRVRWRLVAQKALQYENGDKEFPEGINIEFLQDGLHTTWTGRADRAFFSAEKNLYEFRGAVELKNPIEQRQLHTEELYWDPEQEEIYTTTPFRVEAEDGRVLTGQSFTAKQDLSNYHIVEPQGLLHIEPLK